MSVSIENWSSSGSGQQVGVVSKWEWSASGSGQQVGVVSKWEWLESQMCFRWLKVALWAILETATQRELEFQVVPWARYHLYSNCDCEIISSTWKVLIFDVIPIVSI